MGDEEFRQPGTGFEDSGGYGWPYGSNTFARQPNRNDPLLQLMTNRVRPIGSLADTSRQFRRLALSNTNIFTPEEAAKPVGTSYLDYATSAERAAAAKKVVNDQLDQLRALDYDLETQVRKANAQKKASAAASKLAAQHRRVMGTLSGGSPTADLLGIVGTEFVLGIADSKREQQRRRNILNVGRRGAAATRALSTTGTAKPNRTGAKSTRALSAIRTAPGGTGTLSAAQMGRARSDSVTKSKSESAQSKAARAVLAQTTPMQSRAATKAVTRAPLLQVQSSGLAQLLQQALMPRARVRVRTGGVLARDAQRGNSGSWKSEPVLLTTSGQLPAELQLSASPESRRDRCDCPPKKKRGPPKCKNPLVSRSVKDGIITTKRELKCQPSKPK